MISWLVLADGAKRIGEGLGILEKVKARWVNAPKEAREELEKNLAAVHDFYETFDDTLGELFRIDLDAKPRVVREKLQPFRTARIEARLANARFHCHEIARTYDMHLRGWFSNETGLLSKDERATLGRLFEQDLGNSDNALIYHLQEIAKWMREIAAQVETLVTSQRTDEAETLLETTSQDVQPLRDSVGLLVLSLREAQSAIRYVGIL